MPNISMPLPETQQSIYRPVVLDVVRQVQEITKMPQCQIYFPEEGKVSHQSGTIDSQKDRYVETASKRKNDIEVEEEMDQEEISPTFFGGREYTPIIEDRALGLAVTPVYAKHQVVISFSYNCESKTEAEKWLQDMRMKLSRLRDINTHTVTYHFNLNETAYLIVKKVHELRENQAPLGQDFDQYLKTHASPNLTVVADLTAKHSIFAFAQTQTEIYGSFEFNALPSKPQKNQDTGMWVISFGYKFNYDKPIGCHVRYPIMVHNQLMPYEWVSFTSDETRPVSRVLTDGSRTQIAMDIFRADRAMDRIKPHDGIIRIPEFDDFYPENRTRFTAGIIQALVVVDPSKPRELLSLQELGDVILDEDILNFLLQSEYAYLTRPYRSIFNIALYQNSVLQHWDRLEITPELLVKTKYDLNLRNQYRIRFSVVTDLDFVDKEAIKRIRKYPIVMYKIVQSINKAFRENPEMIKLGISGQLSPCLFDYVYRHLLSKENSVNFGEISFSDSQYLNTHCINQEFVRRLKQETKMQARTMIMGVMAYHKTDPELTDKHGQIYIRHDAPSNP